ncbi:oxidoreductase [Isoalcanivorax indicus]|uniref:oxidoreductase n=1 Tax=Isoalcanivorax indicus TaxID=2202653 RepID=UPI000DBA9759|nr:oxidoreductase [Isoalcanivorax indicus]
MSWSIKDIPDQHGRRVLITGANSGIGLEAARALAGKGAHVILACRSQDKGEAAMADISRDYPKASLEFLPLDLSRQAAVHESAAILRQRHDRLDLLINNAGIMWVQRELTEDGFESQLATNHFGHFTLTGLLLDMIRDVPGARIVTVSSIAHRGGRMHFDDLSLAGNYQRQRAYAQSKVANLIFAIELQRRLTAAGAQAISVACHPGVSGTNLVTPGLVDQSPLKIGAVVRLLMPLFTQSPKNGALPTLYAATTEDIEPGGYYGPARLKETMGPPTRAYATRYARDEEVGERLWHMSCALTDMHYL